ncbi:MAG: hypothetical protein NTW11_00055 [Candidatus Staskawiczbacteria bacterium]|nr:hypothetical protein [Candidatus Staskawiczbacteria bacterium]
MANSTTVKDSTATNITSNPITITVVVIDAKGQPASGARVSITPSDASGTTNNAGEVQFKLGTATKYDITASSGNTTVTVPYYVTKNGATRLIVNPVYVKSVEQKLHPSPWVNSGLIINVGIGLGIVVVLVVVWKLFFKKIRRNKK